MQKLSVKLMLVGLTLFCFLVGLVACDKDDGEDASISYGPEVLMGNGRIRSFIKKDGKGGLLSMGFRMSEKALENLPHNHDQEEISFVLDLPKEKDQTAFDHISVDFAPHGHGPEGVYDTPHFDMHFYMLSKTARQGILMDSKMEILPDSSFLPPHYISTPGEGVPGMGKHWVDVTSPELAGKPFTTTFIYGSYNGAVIFYEPMMTLDWLSSKPDTIVNISEPKAVQKTGFYPNKYSVKFDDAKKEYVVSLEGLRLRQQ